MSRSSDEARARLVAPIPDLDRSVNRALSILLVWSAIVFCVAPWFLGAHFLFGWPR